MGSWPLTPLCHETCRSACTKREKNPNGEQRGTYTGSDAAGQLGGALIERKIFYYRLGFKKKLREELCFHRRD